MDLCKCFAELWPRAKLLHGVRMHFFGNFKK